MDFNKQNILGMIARNQVNPRGAIAYQDQMKQQEAQQQAMEAQKLQAAQLLNKQRQQALQQAGQPQFQRVQGRDGNLYEVQINPQTGQLMGQPRPVQGLGQAQPKYVTKQGGDGKTYQIPVDANGRQIGKAIPIDGLPGASEKPKSMYSHVDMKTGKAIDAQGNVVDLPGFEDTKADAKGNQDSVSAGVFEQEASRAFNILDESINGFDKVTGIPGRASALVPGSDRRRLEGALESLGGLISINALNAMRAASPTGGALGSVTERELAMLKATLGSINPDTVENAEELKTQIENAKAAFMQVIHGTGQQAPADNGIFEAADAIIGGM